MSIKIGSIEFEEHLDSDGELNVLLDQDSNEFWITKEEASEMIQLFVARFDLEVSARIMDAMTHEELVRLLSEVQARLAKFNERGGNDDGN